MIIVRGRFCIFKYIQHSIEYILELLEQVHLLGGIEQVHLLPHLGDPGLHIALPPPQALIIAFQFLYPEFQLGYPPLLVPQHPGQLLQFQPKFIILVGQFDLVDAPLVPDEFFIGLSELLVLFG